MEKVRNEEESLIFFFWFVSRCRSIENSPQGMGQNGFVFFRLFEESRSNARAQNERRKYELMPEANKIYMKLIN